MAWFKRESGDLDTSGKKTVRTEGLWVKCEGCRQIIWKKDLEENLNVCPKCEKHFRIDARTGWRYCSMTASMKPSTELCPRPIR
jgi:acetyl-CoA carboxylase carboxyl transferase subunit beta